MKNKKEKELIIKLSSLIKKWDYEYYIKNNPKVTDEKYDQELKKLFDLENKYNYSI